MTIVITLLNDVNACCFQRSDKRHQFSREGRFVTFIAKSNILCPVYPKRCCNAMQKSVSKTPFTQVNRRGKIRTKCFFPLSLTNNKLRDNIEHIFCSKINKGLINS